MKSYMYLATILLLVIDQVACFQPAPKLEGNSKHASNYGHKYEKNKKTYSDEEREHVDDRIQISEPYKTLIQTSARLALTQSGASKHVNVDMAMDLLSDTSYMLAKPSTLSKFVKAITVFFATILTSAFLFPGLYKFADLAWRDPHRALNSLEGRYLPNGINERTIVNLIGGRTSDFLNSIGLTDSACQEQSICQAGELLRCSFPRVSEFTIKFVEDHFSRPRYRENKYVNAFLLGFVEQDCSSVTLSNISSDNSNNNEKRANSAKSCFGNMFNSFIQSRCNMTSTQRNDSGVSTRKVEYQTIQAGRA